LNLIKRLTGIGTQGLITPELALKIRLVNIFSFISIAAILYGVAINLFLGNYAFTLGSLLFSLVLCIPVFLNHRNQYEKATHAFFIIINFFIFFSDINIGMSSGLYHVYFPITIAYSFFWGIENKKYFISYILLSTGLALLAWVFKTIIPELTETDFNTSPIQEEVFIFISLILIVLMSYFLVSYKHKQSMMLEHQLKTIRTSEEVIKSSLRDKEVLLAEVYHRVKNNLAVVSSLINLQTNLVDNEYTRQVLVDCKNRINSMALIHQKFYNERNYASINFSNYIRELVDDLSYAFDMREKVKIEIHSGDLQLDLNKAIPCGIIVNELITNCLKHAFKDHNVSEPFIKISISETRNRCELKVSDNGKGFDFKQEIQNAKSLGIILIESLVDQLDGTFQYDNLSGTSFTMSFPLTANIS
jgi:two-component sensor histidine kinase